MLRGGPSIADFSSPVRAAERQLQQRLLATAADPHSAQQRDSQGRLPLHVAVWHGAPAHVIEALLNTYPDAAREAMPSSAWLPLHIALQAKADATVIHALLEAHPAAAQCAAAYGWLPLHIAARRGAAREVVEELHRACETAAAARAESGDTPFDLARKYGQIDAATVLEGIRRQAEEAERAQAAKRERQAWKDADAAQQRALEALVEARREEQRLAQRLVPEESGAPAHNAVPLAELREAAEDLKHKLEDEQAQRERAEAALAELQQRVEQNTAEMEQQAAAAAKAKADAKGKKKSRKDRSPPRGAAGDWKQKTAKNGKPFWVNSKTKEKTWKDPTGG